MTAIKAAQNPAYHYGRWGTTTMAPSNPTYHYGRWITGATPPTQSAPFRCWGPAWDRSCKVCAPLPSGGETCTSFKVNDVQRSQGDFDVLVGDSGPIQRAQYVDAWGRSYTPTRF